jgi:hypothetical protein
MSYVIAILSVISTLLTFINAVITKSQQEKLSKILEDLTLRVHYSRPLNYIKKLKEPEYSIYIEIISGLIFSFVIGISVFTNSQNSKNESIGIAFFFFCAFLIYLVMYYEGKGGKKAGVVSLLFSADPLKKVLQNISFFLVSVSAITIIYLRVRSYFIDIDTLLEILLLIPYTVLVFLLVYLFFALPHVLIACFLLISCAIAELFLKAIRKFLWWAVENPRGAWVVFAAFLILTINLVINFLKLV